jgi:[ribosomal protein S5]-alanine N-acetyltransferase
VPLLVPSVLRAAAFYSGTQPELRGDGLVLRRWRRDDGPAVAAAFRDRALQHWMTRTIGPGEAGEYITSRARRWRDRTGVDWVIAAEGDPDRLLGRIGMHRIALGHGVGEVAYWVAAEHRGRRLAPRALCLMCDWAFGVQGMHRIELGHSIANPASCRVAEAAGFTLEGTRRAELLHDDGWHDAHLHARLAEDPAPAP